MVSIKRAHDGRSRRSKKIVDEKKEKYRAKNGFLRNTSTDSKGTTFVNLINHASAYQKGKIEFNEQSKEGGQPK